MKEVRFNKNWQFSNGCTAEFAAALETGIPTLDSEGNPLEQGAAVAYVEQAVEQLGKDRLDIPKELQDNLERLRSLVEPEPTQGEVVRSNLSLTSRPRTAPLRRKCLGVLCLISKSFDDQRRTEEIQKLAAVNRSLGLTGRICCRISTRKIST